MAETEADSGLKHVERSPNTEVNSDARNTAKQPRKIQRSDAERRGYQYAQMLHSHIRKSGGVFLRGEDGALHVLVDGRRIPLNYDKDNELLASLMLEACHVSTLSMAARVALQRLRVGALKEAGRMHFKRFSALSVGDQRLYIPLADGQLLQITSCEIKPVANGNNDDAIWLEHPYDDPLQLVTACARNGLGHFERLIVETQACHTPELKWFIAMHEGLFPFVRDTCPARLILVHIGPAQQGKTSGAQRFTLLHGLGDVKGDYSIAALGNMGDIGLLVMDNKEQANFTQPLIDFLLFLSTGAERGRSREDGSMRVNYSRPVGVITSIEGVYKPEVRVRCAPVAYVLPDGQRLPRAVIEREIKQRRHEMGSALAHVLQRYMEIKGEPIHGTCPVPEFEEHYTALCNLLRAYADIAGKSEGWAETIIAVWERTLANAEPEDEELEHPLSRILFPDPNEMPDLRLQVEKGVVHNDKQGTLCITECGVLLTMLQEQNGRDQRLPKTPTALSRRLRSARFRNFKFLDAESAPGLPQLRRTAKSRPVGFFVEGDG
jgi:hypothetical protein